MRAITVAAPGGPEQIELAEQETPTPGPGEVLIAVAAAGVNRADLLQRQGHYPPPPGISQVMGLEVAGRVVGFGPGVEQSDTPVERRIVVGQAVVALLAGGGYAEYVVAPIGQVAPLPRVPIDLPRHGDGWGEAADGWGDGLGSGSMGGTVQEHRLAGIDAAGDCIDPTSGRSAAAPVGFAAAATRPMTPLEAAAIVETSATVASNFAHIGVRAGQTILIHGGTGGIGAMAVPYAHQLGLRVLTTVGSPAKMAIAEGYGADLAVDYHDDWPAAVMAASGGAGVDAILDIMGAKYLASNLSVLARGGRLCVIGLQGGVRAEINLGLLLNKAATVTATSLRFRPLTEKAAIVSQLVSSVWPLFADGSLPLPQLTSFPLTQAADAQRHLASGDNVGKVVLTVA